MTDDLTSATLSFTWRDHVLYANSEKFNFRVIFSAAEPIYLEVASDCCSYALSFSRNNLAVVKSMVDYDAITFHKFICLECSAVSRYDYSFYVGNLVENVLALHYSSLETSLAPLVEARVWEAAFVFRELLVIKPSSEAVTELLILLGGSLWEDLAKNDPGVWKKS